MTITLTMQEHKDLWDEAEQQTPPQLDPDSGMESWDFPKTLGNGHSFDIELYPDCWLIVRHCRYGKDVRIKQPEWDHPVQFAVLLSGTISDSQGGTCGNGRTMISGSGVQRQITSTCLSTQPHLGINLELSPEWLTTFFPDKNGQLPDELSFLVKENDWQTLIYPKTNSAISGWRGDW